MKYLEEKKESIEGLDEKIENFKKNNPQVSSEKIDELVKNVAEFCMQSIVSNQEFNGRPENGWWTIKDTFGIEIEDQSQLLIESRQLDDIQSKFEMACSNGDIKGIKEGLASFAYINRDRDNSVLTDAASRGDLKILKFFLEDEYIQNNYRYKQMVDFHNWKGTIFQQAYMYGQKPIVEYLINEHNAETTKEAKEALNWQGSQWEEMKETVINMVEKKYLNFMLRFTLDDNPQDKPKPKM
jgi:hypothetical protein